MSAAHDYWTALAEAEFRGIPTVGVSWRYSQHAVKRTRIETGEREKLCPKCGDWKPETDFAPRASRCMPCYKVHR